MITITRRMARDVRAVFRRALHVSSKKLGPPVTLEAGPDGLLVRCRTPDAAAEYRTPGDFPSEQITVPWQLLGDCEAAKDDPVTLEDQGNGQTIAQWRDGSIPQLLPYDAPPLIDKREFPSWPKQTASNEPRLLRALHDAMLTAAVDSVRYATDHVQFDGQAGRIVATDGRQLLVQTGVQFPWQDAVLIPRTMVFASHELPQEEPVIVGKTAKWVSLRVGAWTFHFAIDVERRFPVVDDHIRKPDAAVARLELVEGDAEFLSDALKHLPCDDKMNEPITIDLNGQAIIRAKLEEQEQITELLLSASTCSGGAIRFNSNRGYLARALQLSFRHLNVFTNASPVQCQDDNRTYLWAVLEPEAAIKPSDNAVRIESSPGPEPPHPVTQARKQIQPMATSKSNTNGHADQNGRAANNGASEHGVDGLIQQAETLKASLRQTLSETNNLIVALKAHKKQNKAVESALSSLRQLQTAAG